MNYFNPAVMRAGAWLSCGELHGFALSQPRLVPTAQGVLPMSISNPPRPFRTVSLAGALAFTLIAAPCVYALSAMLGCSEAPAPSSDLGAAALRGDLAEVERLLKAGADVNAKTRAA